MVRTLTRSPVDPRQESEPSPKSVLPSALLSRSDRATLLWLLLALCMAGCAERVTKANFDRIEVGMKLSDVETFMGKPHQKYQDVVSWSTNHSRTVISVVIDDRGIVVDKNSDNLQ